MKAFGALLVAATLQLAESDRCCYGTHGSTCSDCNSADNWCSASAERCKDCSGVLCNESSFEDSHDTASNASHHESEYEREKREQEREQEREREEQAREQAREREEQKREREREEEEQKREREEQEEEQKREREEQQAERDREAAEKANRTEFASTHSCCYDAGCKSCESAGDTCSTSAARCADCGGTLCSRSEIAAPSSGPAASGDEEPWQKDNTDEADGHRSGDGSQQVNSSDVNDAVLLGQAPAEPAVYSPVAAFGVAGAVVLMISSALAWQRRARTSAAEVPLLSEEAATSQA